MTIDWLELDGEHERVLYANAAFAVTVRVDRMGISITERYHGGVRPDSTLELDWDDWNAIVDMVEKVVDGS